ncbi:MAG: hypothetical protein COY42_21485 [Armatimonadetes bacterium CG_4_10_14_0_8_um_filter_66_14]|nr:MAG: hypothetical protein COY42_21485 [Armatimonadetes bacterium CG_4_10_14_0_8_um_filter_66_14]
MRAAAERSVGILPAFSHGATRRALKTLRLALRTLIAHKLRTTLSLLGITIGVASVITMLAIGQGTRAEVLRQLESFGTNLVLVSAGQVKTFAGRERQVGNVTTLTLQDAEAIAEECSGVMRVAPAQQQKLPVKYEDNTTTTNVLGTTPDFAEVRNFQAARGEFLTDEYLTASARVAVLGQTVVENLFGGSDPLGERIRIQRVPFTVIGVLTQKGLDLSGNDQDDVILIPVTTALRRVFNLDHLNVVYAQARDEAAMPRVVSDITELLRERHRLRSGVGDDFTVQNQAELIRTQQEVTSTFTTLLGSIAAVSLLVGGVGILAVMLIAVKERTREIGIRRAVGARQRDILLQFVLEALTLSLMGGLLGVALGTASSWLTAALMHWPVLIAPQTVLLSFSFSGVIGVFFGVYPARKAARLNPIDALRS